MSAKAIAVLGCTYKITPSSVTGAVAPVTPPSLMCSIDAKGIYRGAVQVSVSGVTEGDFVVANPVLVTLTSTDSKTMTDGFLTLVKGDSGMGSGTGINALGVEKSISFTVEIDNAGQSSVSDSF